VQSITARLAGHDLKADVGEVRLHYAVGVELTDRELLTLRTFASALRTAVRNASAFAEARRLALRNAHAALHDPLTGLANRRRLQEYAEEALGRPGDTALVVLDIDLFREVNETLGYLAGDRCWSRWRGGSSARSARSRWWRRLDGDEFAGGARGRHRRHRRAAGAGAAGHPRRARRPGRHAGPGGGQRRPRLADPTRRPPTTRAAPWSSCCGEPMWRCTRPSATGPGSSGYEAARDTADVAALMLGGDLPRAIADREFAVSFQPIVDLATGQMVSAEALARWRHPERGDLDPRRFLAAVERSGCCPLSPRPCSTRRWPP
jgi:predicted signal transduction protein with EAL and GGDEF domain